MFSYPITAATPCFLIGMRTSFLTRASHKSIPSAANCSIPALSVTVPPGQLSVSIPVTALAPGSATVRASLNGSVIERPVTVRPAGPILVGLTPAVLPLAPDAVLPPRLVPGNGHVDEPLVEVPLGGLGGAPLVLEHLVGGEVLASPDQLEPHL